MFKDLGRAMLESNCYQTADLFEAMKKDGVKPERLRVDGVMVKNNWLCSFLADILDISSRTTNCTETKTEGAAILVGLQISYLRHWMMYKNNVCVTKNLNKCAVSSP